MKLENVPTTLRNLLTLAERWGIWDDYERTNAVRAANTADLRLLVDAIQESDAPAFEQWLVGASSSQSPTSEYLAFTCLLMAADQARLELKRR